MKYIKLFESFREDFYKSIRDLENKYESEKEQLFNEAKVKVDEFMFDLTDDFSDSNFESDFIESGDLSIWYHLRCDRDELEKLVELMKDVRTRLIDELGLNMKVSMSLSYGAILGYNMDIEKLISFISGLKSITLAPNSFFRIKIQVL